MIALSVIAPIIITALFGSVFGGDLTHLEVYIVVDDDNFTNIFSDEIVEKMEEYQKIQFNTSESDINSAKDAVNNNYTQAALIFPERFTEATLLGKGSEVELYVSNLNLNTSNYIVSSFQSSLSHVMTKYFGDIQVDVIINYTYQGTLDPLPEQINVSLINLDVGWSMLNDKLSDEVCDILEDDETIDIIKVRSVKKYEDEVKRGEVRGIICFPEEFTYDALINKEIKVKVRLDGAEPQACNAIMGALSSALSDTFEDTFDKSAFEIDEYYYNNIEETDEPVESITYFTPAIIGFIAFFFGFILTMLAFIRERKEGTMERILTSPLKRSEVIIGYILSFSILSVIQSTVTIIVAILLFNAQIEFSALILLQAYLVIYLLLLSALGLGIFLSTLAKTEFQIIQFIPLVILPFMLLSGVWAPVESLPEPLRVVSSFIPLTYANNIMRDLFLRGENIIGLIIPISILAGFACLMVFLGIIKLNKTLQ
ncbi:MAG: ABC transporter permease [Promethearchaeota archaeon]|nr:MAG: ABC transporter permease [Candidatus Lokiarchaeota archaeon]